MCPTGGVALPRCSRSSRSNLRSAGLEWVLPFRLKPDSNNEYWIVGGSSHLSGFATIKEAYWTVDKSMVKASPRHRQLH